MTDDNTRITQLTTDAIRSTGEKMVHEIRRQVEQVDAMAEAIHTLAKRYEDEIGERTLELTDHITAYTALGAKTTEMFAAMSAAMQPLKNNGNGEPVAHVEPVPRKRLTSVDMDSELGKLAASVPSSVDGRR